MTWEPIDLTDDPLEPWCNDDPADMIGPTLEQLLHRPAWHRHANCRGQVELFFLDRGQDSRPAKELCSTCPVLDTCREAGASEGHGLWAGEGPMQRRAGLREAA